MLNKHIEWKKINRKKIPNEKKHVVEHKKKEWKNTRKKKKLHGKKEQKNTWNDHGKKGTK